MTKRDVFSLAVKIVGIWTLVAGIVSVPGMFALVELPKSNYLGFSSQLIAILLYIGPLLTIVTGIILLFHSDSISFWIIRNDVSFSLPGWMTDRKEVFQFALIITGLILLAQDLPALAYAIYSVLHSMFSGGLMLGNAARLNFAHIQVLQSAIGVAIAVYLLFSKKGACLNLRGERHDNE